MGEVIGGRRENVWGKFREGANLKQEKIAAPFFPA